MSLDPGTRLGAYEILGQIGAGGMGEVYRARDTRLGRDVALKVLPPAARRDADRLRRFEQEARAAAALNNPNLLAVFDVGEDGDVSYLVSELLEGETLRERLQTGPVPTRKAIDYGAQIARGLAAAHEKGIVHRDLKPENVFITRDGRVKILDFGIAKLTDPAAASGGTVAATIDAGTSPGTVLGTVGYMSPEQVRALPTDHRTDIFSLGTILYEMVSGRRAFSGGTHADTMSAILNTDPPDLAEPGRDVPAGLERLIRRCLEKSPDERFQSARDLAFGLESAGTGTHGTGSFTAAAAKPSRARLSTATVAALIIGIAAGAAGAWAVVGRTPALAVPSFHQLSFRRGTISGARFSPDGDTIVYSAAWEGADQELYTTRVGAAGERPLGVAGRLLSVSKSGEIALLKDSKLIANWAETGTLARVPLGGGAPREILRDVGDAIWSPDGQQLAITRYLPDQRRWRLEYPIGTVLYETDQWIEMPRLSSDQTKFLLLEHPANGDNRGRIILVTRDGKKSYLIEEYSALMGLAWSPSGDEALFSGSAAGNRVELFAVRPGRSVRRTMPGPAPVVVQDVAADGRLLVATMSLKNRLVVKTPNDAKERDISWFDFGVVRDLAADGSLMLFDEQGEGGGPGYSVFVRRTDGTPPVRLGSGNAGRLSPDLQWALTTSPSEPPNRLTIFPVGPGEPKKITIPLEVAGVPRWFPDGRTLAVAGNEPGHRPRTYEFEIDSGKVRPLTPEGTAGTNVSPDGKRLLVTAGGRRLVWPLDGGEPTPIPGLTAQDTIVRWTADGRSVLVSTTTAATTRAVSRLDLATGKRSPIVTIAPSDSAGVTGFTTPVMSADGGTYVYVYNQFLTDLFVSEHR